MALELPAESDKRAYREAVVERNVLALTTVANRKITWDNLNRLYLFDNSVFFRNFRQLWYRTSEEQRPALGAVLALKRDGMFFEAGQALVSQAIGTAVDSGFFQSHIETSYPGRYSSNTAASMSRNLFSSYKQSGWVDEKTLKRKEAKPGAAALSLALFLAWTRGLRGSLLFDDPLVALLLTDIPEPLTLLWEAHRSSFINYYDSGGISDIRFPGWLTPEEQETYHGAV